VTRAAILGLVAILALGALASSCGGEVGLVPPQEREAGTSTPGPDAAPPASDASNTANGPGIVDTGAPEHPEATAPTRPEAGIPACAMQLDPSFGVGGISTFVNFPHPQPEAIAFQPDGRILVSVGEPYGAGAAVARFDAAGGVDETYGSGGLASVALSYAEGLAVQPDGKTLVVDYDTPTLARLTPQGTLDTTFGGNGSGGGLAVSPTQWPNWWGALALLGDGATLVGGSADFNTGGATMFLARYDRYGLLDTTFGAGGSVNTSSMGPCRHILALPDGSFLVGGEAYAPWNPPSQVQPVLERYTATGALDIAFGSGGTATASITGGGGVVAGIGVQPTGAVILSVAMAGTPNDDFLLLRYTPEGQLDPTFGQGGMARADFFGQRDYATGLSVLPGGALLVAGTVDEPTDAGRVVDFGVARFTASGQPDTGFAPGGKLVTRFPLGGVDEVDAQGLQADGKLVVAGYGVRAGDAGQDSILTLARYACP
jgi:uncharacterized delta-60 repeat protein